MKMTCSLSTYISRSAYALLLVATVALAQKGPDVIAQYGDITGMYSYLHEGEFLQVTVDTSQKNGDTYNVTGYVSRFGDSDTDKGRVLDQFIEKGTLTGDLLEFKTKAVHGTWFSFSGLVSRGEAKDKKHDGYFVIRGTLTRNDIQDGKTVSNEREIESKLLAQIDDGQGSP